MALPTGAQAPDFSLPTKTADGPKQVKLSDYRGKQTVLLLFVPMAFTGTCTDELCSVSQSINRYATLNAAVLGISGDNPFAQEAWAQKEHINFPLLSDYEHHVARSYDVAYDSFLPQLGLGMGGVAKRAAFLVDKEGVIQYAESKDDARDLPDFEAILSKLQTLR
jgi:peroxiredoxin